MKFAILFVCMGNICRSPTAEGIFRKMVEGQLDHLELYIDSAGTTGYHAGEHADSRAIEAARQRGYDLSRILSRQVRASDFEEFDLIIAMDKDNHENLNAYARRTNNDHHLHKLKLFLSYSAQNDYHEVPDPYYGGAKGFDLVIDLIEDASKGLIKAIQSQT